MIAKLLRAAAVGGLFALVATSAVADVVPTPVGNGVVGMLDARLGGRAVKLTLSQPVRAKKLRYLNLSQLETVQVSCCVAIDKRAAKPQAQAGGEVWAGTLSRRATQGFFGVVMVNAPTRIERTSPNELLLSWRAASADANVASIRVIHCVSAEGLNVRVLDSTKGVAGTELSRHYVSLGMDVEPDCTPVLMPPG